MTHSPLRRGSRPLLLLVALMLLSAGQASAQSPWGGPDPQRREAMLRQQAEAMARLNGRQRRDYYEARRELERRNSSLRLDQLSRAERCLERARGVSAVQGCQRSQQDQTMQLRRQEMTDLAELQRRFGLPGWGKSVRQGWDSRPAPKPLGPSSYATPPYGGQQLYAPQPFGQAYGGQAYGQPAGSNFMTELLQSLLAF